MKLQIGVTERLRLDTMAEVARMADVSAREWRGDRVEVRTNKIILSVAQAYRGITKDAKTGFRAA
jgi:hypothetical protein